MEEPHGEVQPRETVTGSAFLDSYAKSVGPGLTRGAARGSAMNRSGAQLLIETLKAEKVEILFGFPGGVVIPLFDAFYGEREVKLVLARHEQGAVHAADGYARSTGRVGVCIVTSGPGATNTVTGLATANYRLGPPGGAHGPGLAQHDWKRRLPGSRHRRASPARSQSTTTL